MSNNGVAEMPRAILGRTGIVTSALSLGTWGFGDVGAADARVRGESEMVDVLRTAFAAGVRLLDCAEAYDNQATLGRLLKEAEAPSDLVISTKFGHGRGFTGDLTRRAVEKSLVDLDIPRIPLMMLHDPRNSDDMAVIMGNGGALPALREMQEEGIVGCIGIATGTYGPLREAVDSGEFDCIQFPRLFTLLNQAARDSGLLADAKARGMGTLNAAPFAGNILATGTSGKPLYAYRYALPEVVSAVQLMERRCKELSLKLPTAALAYSLSEPLVDVTVVGVRRAEELRWDLDAVGMTRSRADLESIASAGEIDTALLGGPSFVTAYPDGRMTERPE